MAKSLKVEVFAIGKWNGMTFTKHDLQAIVSAFHAIGSNLQVPLKMGHNDEQPFTDGQPALGWVTDLELTSDNKIMALFEDVPEIVYKAFETKLYKNVSIELAMGVDYKGNHYPYVLSGVALLGADIPAVNTLSDLQAYMSSDFSIEKRAAFTAVQTKQTYSSKGDDMDDKERIASLEAQVKNFQSEIDRLSSDLVKAQTNLAENKAKFRALEQAEEVRKEGEKRNLMETQLNSMVQGGKISPAMRDEFMRDYDDAGDKEIVMSAVSMLQRTVENSPAYFGREQAREKARREIDESDKSASDILAQRTREYMVKHGEKNFTAAKRAVMGADPELAERYVKGV